MVSVSCKIKDLFFDRPKVKAAVASKRLSLLSNAGGFVRRTARNSMKNKGKARPAPKNANGKAYQKWLEEIRNQPTSNPGQPPFCHTDDPVVTLKNILYGYDMSSGGVIVGPVGLRHKRLRQMGGTIPTEIHEFGGSVQIPEKQVTFPNGGRKWVPLGKRGARPGQPVRKRSANYPARPYMKPAIDKLKSKSRFKDLWFTNPGDSRRAAG